MRRCRVLIICSLMLMLLSAATAAYVVNNRDRLHIGGIGNTDNIKIVPGISGGEKRSQF
ncbi:MAG: hypothetical protein Q8930_15670 [Bacillota bacterium]|nr:hypothetical protein [Bacillota bacterium]